MGMDNQKSHVSWGVIFGVVSVWFGAHAGGGFASGSQTMNFFVKYGWPAVFTPVLAMAILALVYRVIITMCNQYGVSNYSDWSHKLYSPYDKVVSPVYEVCNLGAGILATSASIAGAAAVLNETFSLPYMMCVVIMAVVTILLSMFGAKVISAASSVLVVLIMVSVVIITVSGLVVKGPHIGVDVAAGYAPLGVGAAIWKSITYASFQIFSLLGTFGVCCQLKNAKNCNKATVLGFIINTAMLTGLTLLCLAYREDVTGNTLPILTICKSLGNPLLTVLYTVALFCAFVSTAVSVVFGTIARFGKFYDKVKLPQNLWNGIVGLIVVAVAMGAATFGLTAIVAVGYNYLGIIGIFLVAIPCLTVGTMRIRKTKADKEQ